MHAMPNCSKCAYETCGSRKARCDAKQQNSSRSRDRSGMSHAASAISRTCGLQRTRLVSSEPLVANVSSNGAFFGRGESRPMRVLAPRGARLPPLGLEIIRSDNTDVAANEFDQITRLAILHRTHPSVVLDSHAIAKISTSTPKEAICKCTAPTFTYWRRQPLAGDPDRV